jgi:hypothetical protein
VRERKKGLVSWEVKLQIGINSSIKADFKNSKKRDN